MLELPKNTPPNLNAYVCSAGHRAAAELAFNWEGVKLYSTLLCAACWIEFMGSHFPVALEPDAIIRSADAE